MNRQLLTCASSALGTVLIISLLGFSGCAPHVGSVIEVPQIPHATAPAEAETRLNTAVAIDEIKDVRQSVMPSDPQSTVGNYTSPEGQVGEAVQTALTDALMEKGVAVSSTAPLRVWGEVRKWRTQVVTKTTSAIDSEAALYIEVLDSSGKRLYSGTYHGSRASSFPVASASDIRASLGMAMSQAIGQVVEDEEFLNSMLR